MFEKYHWLILGTTPSLLDKLEPVPLTVNCDVTVAISTRNGPWAFYDVYNPSVMHGGTFRRQNIGALKNVALYSTAKFDRRRNLTGIAFETAMVVCTYTQWCGE